MAIGMKGWLGIVAASMALVAVWALPPRSTRINRVSALPERARAIELVRAERRVHAALQARRWSDSLSALTVQTAVDGLALATPPSDQVTDEGMSEWRGLLGEHLAALPRRDGRTVLGYFLQPQHHAAEPGGQRRRWAYRLTFVGEEQGMPYCFEVDVTDRPTNLHLREHGRDGLGACTLYAQYGPAGPRIQEWLDRGALGLGSDFGEHEPTRYRPIDIDAPVFGMNRYVNPNPDAQACQSGDPSACLRAVTTATSLAGGESEAAYILANSPTSLLFGVGWVFGPNDARMLSDLETEFGTDAFTRFWSSDREVPEAFQAAFGIELGSWVLAWVDDEIGLERAGPLPGSRAVLLSLLALMALGAAASGISTRRRAA
jgi:hypothetical protein